ncbi:MAG TPA: pitrilysin family protein [Candidatus Saccharimonadales bacterium]|nr:pitrilysin family protein [Candidatus Saccharimonadales bacterium]
MQYKRTILPNGLTLITVEMPSFESATVLLMVGAGSRYENRSNNGISHFLEHMAFKGTTKRPSAMDISSLIDGIGGEFNAFTSKEYTGYYVKAQSNHVELCLDLLSDMLNNSLFDPKEIDKEKGVIIEEMNMYEDSPMRNLGDVYERLMYGDSPMGWDTVGTKEVIHSVTREFFIEYMKSLYSADNMTLVVAGGVDSAKVIEIVQKYFGDMPRFETIQAPKVADGQEKPATHVKKKETEQAHVALGFRTVGLGHPDEYPLEVLAGILGGGMSSRLFHEVREKRGLAYYVRTSSDNYTDVGTLVTTAGVDPKRAEAAITVILEELEKVKQPGAVSAEELKKAKEYLNGHFVLDLEDSRSVAIYYAHQEVLEEEIINPEENIKKINAVTLDDISRVAKKYIVPETLNLAVIGNFASSENFEKLLKLK